VINAFPKICPVGTVWVSCLLDGETEVVVEEKTDGSMLAFGWLNGELSIRSKRCELYVNAPTKAFRPIVEYLDSIKDKIPKGYTFYGEYFKSEKQNTLKYDRIPKNHLMLFGMENQSTRRFKESDEFAELFGFDTAPVLYRGTLSKVEELLPYLEQESFLGGPLMEGVVVKAYSKPYLIGGAIIPITCGKLVSEKFQEVNRASWKEHSTKNQIQEFIASFKTEARWAKAVQHLQDAGELEHLPKDIGKLVQEVQNDVMIEEEYPIKEWLWKHYSRQIKRVCVHGMPEWYKEEKLGMPNLKKLQEGENEY